MGNYTVQKGDGWNAISKKTGISVEDLMRYNPEYRNGKVLHPGVNIKTSGKTESGFVNTVKGWFGGNDDKTSNNSSNQTNFKSSKPVKAGAYYVNFSDQDIQTGIGDGKQRLGHAGVLIVDENGNQNYYEYGRYGTSTGINGAATLDQNQGNWQHKSISGHSMDAVSAALLKGKDASTVRLTYVPADTNKVREYILSEAKNPNRDSYNIPGVDGSLNFNDKSCGSEASDAIAAGWDASIFGKAVRSAVGAASKLIPAKQIGNIATSILPGGRGVSNPLLLNYTPQDYEDKWHNRGYETYTYNSSNNH